MKHFHWLVKGQFLQAKKARDISTYRCQLIQLKNFNSNGQLDGSFFDVSAQGQKKIEKLALTRFLIFSQKCFS